MKQGRDIVLDILRSEEVTHIFGNPGTTELALIDALLSSGDFKYVLGLQEASAVGMADGYARATNRPAFLNLHATAGLGNGLGALSNASYTNVPLVVTAGQQDYRHILDDPWLTGDLVGLAKPVTKWAHEVRTVDEIGPVLRRAFKDANSYPKGPVFVSLPFHFMDESTAIEAPEKSNVYNAAIADGLDVLAAELAQTVAGEVAIIACDEISTSESLADVVNLAEAIGADVFGAPVHDSVVFPTSHPLWRSSLPPVAAIMRVTLSHYKKVFVIGDRGFLSLIFSGSPVSDAFDILHLSADSQTVARTFSTKCGVVGEIGASIRSLLPLLLPDIDTKAVTKRIDTMKESRRVTSAAENSRIEKRYSEVPIPPEVAAHAIVAALSSEVAIVDEAPAITKYVRQLFSTSTRLQYNFSKGGGLGWAMPAAVGIALARPDIRTVCLTGDGSAMYSPQAMWTAANEKLDITFIVVNNCEYGVLKDYLRSNYPSDDGNEKFIGMDVVDPQIDYLALGKSMGIPGRRIVNADEIPLEVASALEQPGPNLIEIMISPTSST